MIPDKILINLKILSKIPKNGRICKSFNGIIALEAESLTQSIRRFFRNDSRNQSVLEINSIVQETVDYIYHILRSKIISEEYLDSDEYRHNVDDLEMLQKELELAKTGIENLKFTYENDQTIISKIDIILLKIIHVLNELKIKIPFLKSNKFHLDRVIVQ
jgi:hypothetical protein